ncbi:sulfatase [Halalkalibacter sp. AB-rgal2]|uniref:sulfatase family protein n=1 Tax=Halalkalibacter sp. AB-rgal2 TaxID=3242695 RepID=UPI00359D7A47
MSSKERRPNILLILLDQLRADYLGYAQTVVHTPHINRLAKRGVTFTQAVCNSPACVPSRASMMSGRYPHRINVLSNDQHFPLNQKTYMQELRQAGYQVAGIGKLELHKSDLQYGEKGNKPINYHFGYTHPFETEGKMSSAKSHIKNGQGQLLTGPYQYYLEEKGLLQTYIEDYRGRERRPPWYSSCSILEEQDRIDSFVGRQACSFIEEASSENPWFCSVNFLSPHDPWDAPKRYYDMYKDTLFPLSIPKKQTGKPSWIIRRQKDHSANLTEEALNEVKRHYVAMITHLDEWVGALVDRINERHEERETIVLFASDHGEMLGDHGLFRKNVMYEGAVRVPLIISDPTENHIAGTKNDELVELIDLFPTILEMAGIDCTSHNIDGKTLYPIIKGQARGNHKAFQYAQWNQIKMVRTHQYKLIEHGEQGMELYDLQADRKELNNLVNEKEDIVYSLTQLLNQLA